MHVCTVFLLVAGVPGKITSRREGVGHSGHFWISGGLWLELDISEAQRPNTDPEHSGVCLNHLTNNTFISELTLINRFH